MKPTKKPSLEKLHKMVNSRIKDLGIIEPKKILEDILSEVPKMDKTIKEKVITISTNLLNSRSPKEKFEKDQEKGSDIKRQMMSIDEILKKAKESKFSGSCMLSGIINNGTFYHTVFLNVDGSYIPLVVTDKKEFIKVETDDNGYFFQYKGEIYRYYSELVFNPIWDVYTTDNSVVDLIKNYKVDKELFDEIRSLIYDCWDINEAFEYDVHSTFPILTYIQNLLGKTIYLILVGDEDTGKSMEQRCLARLTYNGTFKGKGSPPVTARLIHLLGVSLGVDEFEKMSKDELTVVQGIANNGFYIDGVYWFTNMNKKEVSEQIQLLRAFGFKTFSLNRLGNKFESNFLSRCHIVVSVRQNRTTIDLTKPSKEVEQRFQVLRNKIFTYCLFNGQKIVEDIEKVKKELEKEEKFGRKRDTYSIILGIYRHFKGDYKKLKDYLENKEVLNEGGITDIESSILNLIVEKFTEQGYVEVSNEDIKNRVFLDLGITEESEYKPTAKSIGRTLVRLKLIRKKSDKVRSGTRGNYVYTIHKEIARDVLSRLQLSELLEKIPKGIEKQKMLHPVPTKNQRSETSEPSETSVNVYPLKAKNTELTEVSEPTELRLLPKKNDDDIFSEENEGTEGTELRSSSNTKKKYNLDKELRKIEKSQKEDQKNKIEKEKSERWKEDKDSE